MAHLDSQVLRELAVDLGEQILCLYKNKQLVNLMSQITTVR